jgi:cell division transport system permease protein
LIRTRLRRRARAWGRRQLYSLFSSLGTLVTHKTGTTLTVLVLGIALVLPIGLYVTLNNLRGIDLQAEEWGSITVFLRSSVTQQEALELTDAINARPDARASAVSPQQGMEEFRAASGFGQALDVLESNPLPWVLLVQPKAQADENLTAAVETLADWLTAQNAVDTIQLDYKWLQRLSSLLELGNALVTILSVMFSLAVVVVIANTIRMDVANRSDEIEVLSLVGAGDSFIRQPFLYSGFWYGLMGSAVALLLLHASIAFLQSPLENLLDAYGNAFVILRLNFSQVVFVLLGGGFLGLLGAWVAVERYLRVLRRGGLLGRI